MHQSRLEITHNSYILISSPVLGWQVLLNKYLLHWMRYWTHSTLGVDLLLNHLIYWQGFYPTHISARENKDTVKKYCQIPWWNVCVLDLWDYKIIKQRYPLFCTHNPSYHMLVAALSKCQLHECSILSLQLLFAKVFLGGTHDKQYRCQVACSWDIFSTPVC